MHVVDSIDTFALAFALVVLLSRIAPCDEWKRKSVETYGGILLWDVIHWVFPYAADMCST